MRGRYSDYTLANPLEYSLEEWCEIHFIDPKNVRHRGQQFLISDWDEADRNRMVAESHAAFEGERREQWEALTDEEKLEIVQARDGVPSFGDEHYDEFYPWGEELRPPTPRLSSSLDPLPPGEDPEEFRKRWEEFERVCASLSVEDEPPTPHNTPVNAVGREKLDADRDRRQRQALAEGIPLDELPQELDPDDYYDFQATYDGRPWTEISSSGKSLSNRCLPSGLTHRDIDAFLEESRYEN